MSSLNNEDFSLAQYIFNLERKPTKIKVPRIRNVFGLEEEKERIETGI